MSSSETRRESSSEHISSFKGGRAWPPLSFVASGYIVAVILRVRSAVAQAGTSTIMTNRWNEDSESFSA